MRRGKSCAGFSKVTRSAPPRVRLKCTGGLPPGCATYVGTPSSVSMRRNSKAVVSSACTVRLKPSIIPPCAGIQYSWMRSPLVPPHQWPLIQSRSWTRESPPAGVAAGASSRTSTTRHTRCMHFSLGLMGRV
jgi:hypothetical protein